MAKQYIISLTGFEMDKYPVEIEFITSLIIQNISVCLLDWISRKLNLEEFP